MSSRKGSPGAALVDRIIADMKANGLEPDGREVELLDLARRLADRLAALERSIEADGLSSRPESGRIVANPLVAEALQTASAPARVLASVQMSDTSKDAVKQLRRRPVGGRTTSRRLRVMARRIADVVVEDGSLRAHLIAKCKADIAKLPTESDVYDFSVQRDRLLDKLAALEAGRPVEVHRLEIPIEIRPGRDHLLCRLVGNRLEAAPYQRADGTVR